MRKVLVAVAVAVGAVMLMASTATVDLVVAVALWRMLAKPAKVPVREDLAPAMEPVPLSDG
jgi:hypothetical protein